MSFQSLLIDFNLFDVFWTDFNSFHRDELTSGFEFGLKMLIKSQFGHGISQNLSLSRLHRLSLSIAPPWLHHCFLVQKSTLRHTEWPCGLRHNLAKC